MGQKFKSDEAIKDLEDSVSTIKSNIKKKGEQQADGDYNGIKNFPKLCTKLLLEKPYFADCLKQS